MDSLFHPLKINNLSLSNRIVMPPMALDIATEQGEITQELIKHYLSRAWAQPQGEVNRKDCYPRSGVGLIIVEHSYVNIRGKAHPRQLGIYDDFLINGLKLLTREIHEEGVPVGIQISHAGARALDSPVAPSVVNCPFLSSYGQGQSGISNLPRELNMAEIQQLIKEFAEAALRAKEAGFDLIEIHGAHGYLLNQFYSPLTNHREDMYGGTWEKRLRFPTEVTAAVRQAVGPEMPIFYRLGADDRIPGGNCVEDSIRAIPFLVEAGVDCLDISGGICGYLNSGPECFFTYIAKAIKPITDIPIIVTGGIRNCHTANKLIVENIADLVGIGRALLDDAGWARKAWMEVNQ